MSCCKTALTKGRYRWRHDKILREVANLLNQGKDQLRCQEKKGPVFISFVPAGKKSTGSAKDQSGVLRTAADWQLLVDLGRQLKFLEDVVKTKLRPDILLLSKKTRQIILKELTVPWED